MIHNFRTFRTLLLILQKSWFGFKNFSSKFGFKEFFWKTFFGGGVIFLGGSKFEFKEQDIFLGGDLIFLGGM